MKKSNTLFSLMLLWILACTNDVEVIPKSIDLGQSYMERIETVTIDTLVSQCPCFSAESLQDLLHYKWMGGWWSDVVGCKDEPYDQLQEIWLTHVGLPEQNFNLSIQAGEIKGRPFVSTSVFNHLTGQYDVQCGGYTTTELASPCKLMLRHFLEQLKQSHPDWDYCRVAPR